MFGLDEINRQKEKTYRSIQKRIDNDPKYRESFIKAREESILRVAKTGWSSNYDDFLGESFLMTLTPQERDDAINKMASMSIFDTTIESTNEQDK